MLIFNFLLFGVYGAYWTYRKLVLFKLVRHLFMTSFNVLSDTFVPTSLWTPILHALVHLRVSHICLRIFWFFFIIYYIYSSECIISLGVLLSLSWHCLSCHSHLLFLSFWHSKSTIKTLINFLLFILIFLFILYTNHISPSLHTFHSPQLPLTHTPSTPPYG